MITIIKLLEISLSIIGSQFNRIQFNLYTKNTYKIQIQFIYKKN